MPEPEFMCVLSVLSTASGYGWNHSDFTEGEPGWPRPAEPQGRAGKWLGRIWLELHWTLAAKNNSASYVWATLWSALHPLNHSAFCPVVDLHCFPFYSWGNWGTRGYGPCYSHTAQSGSGGAGAMKPGYLLLESVPWTGSAWPPPCSLNSCRSVYSCLNPLTKYVEAPTRFHLWVEKQLEMLPCSGLGGWGSTRELPTPPL